MSFRLVDKKIEDKNGSFLSCKDFFKKIRDDVDNSSPIKFDMDIFMLCLILGLNKNKKEDYSKYTYLSSFSSKYIDTHQKIIPLITGLIISKSMKLKNIDKNEKDKVKQNLQEVLDENDNTYLKPKYIELMHEYYVGGYCVLLKEFNNKPPEEVSIFFEKYNKLIIN